MTSQPKRTIEEFISFSFEEKIQGRFGPYHRMIAFLDPPEGKQTDPIALKSLYNALSNFVSKIIPGFSFNELLKAVLAFNWTTKQETVDSYSNFLHHLLACHVDFVVPVLRKLIGWLCPGSIPAADLSDDAILILHNNIHSLLYSIRNSVPSSTTVLYPILVRNFPYKQSNCQTQLLYVEDLLRISEYAPELCERILTLILEKIVQIDIEIPNFDSSLSENNENSKSFDLSQINGKIDELSNSTSCKSNHNNFPDDNKYKIYQNADKSDNILNSANLSDNDSEISKESNIFSTMTNPEDQNQIQRREMADKLDKMMELMFEYLEMIQQKNDISSLSQVFLSLLRAFEHSILPTRQSTHTQFLIFKICSFRNEYAESFLKFLLDVVVTISKNSSLRQFCSLYIASFIVRSNFLRRATVVQCFEMLNNFAHQYLRDHEPKFPVTLEESQFVHRQLFYAVCQSIFYIFVHREGDFLPRLYAQSDEQNEENIDIFNFEALINSRLNPLRYCCSKVVGDFARIIFRLKIFDCSQILSLNRENYIFKMEQRHKKTHIDKNEELVQSNNSIDKSLDASSQFDEDISVTDSIRRLELENSSIAIKNQKSFDKPNSFSLSLVPERFPFDPYQLPKSSRFLNGIYSNIDEFQSVNFGVTHSTSMPCLHLSADSSNSHQQLDNLNSSSTSHISPLYDGIDNIDSPQSITHENNLMQLTPILQPCSPLDLTFSDLKNS